MRDAKMKEIYDTRRNLIIRCWYAGDKLHRADGSAWIEYDEDGRIIEERWYQMNKLHNKKGPAIIKILFEGA